MCNLISQLLTFLLFFSVHLALGTNAFDDTPMIDFQFRGTHNSYHKRKALNPPPINIYDYSDYSFSYLLDNGVRGLEIDLDGCDNGGYRDSTSGACTDWRVQHVTIFDNEATCETLTACMNDIAGWSYKYRGYHLPLFIKIELKNIGVNGDWENLDDIIELTNVINDIFDELYNGDSSSDSSDSSDDLNCSPIASWKNDFLGSFGGSWTTTTLSQMRGKVLFYVTPGTSFHIVDLVTEEGQGSGVLSNNWPDDVGDVLWGSCNAGHARSNFDNSEDWCVIADIGRASTITSIASYNKYMINSNVDSRFAQIDGHEFIFDENDASATKPISVNVNGVSSSFTTWQYTLLFNNMDISGRNDNGVTSYSDCLSDSTLTTANDGLLYDCEIFEWFYYNEGESDAIDIYNSLPTLRSEAGVSDNYFSNVEPFGNALDSFGIDLLARYTFKKETAYSTANDVINAGSNIINTDFPFGTSNVEDPYIFSLTLTCDSNNDDSDVPARLKSQCLAFVESDESGSDDNDSDEDNTCSFGIKIDQF